MLNKKNIFYIGMHPDTPVFIERSDDFKISGIVYLDSLIYFKLNIFDLLFQLSYYLKFKKLNRLAKFFGYMWLGVGSIFSSTLYKRYKNYLKLSIREDVNIVDYDDTNEVKKIVEDKSIDLCVVNSWSILPNEIINLFKKGIINIHPSKLPQYRGSLPTLWSLKNGDSSSAVSFLLIDNGIDSGKILKQVGFSIDVTDLALDLEKKVDLIIEKEISEVMKTYLIGDTNFIIQNEKEISTTGKYIAYSEIKPKEEKSLDILNKVLLYPYLEPFFYCHLSVKNQEIHIKKIKRISEGIKDDLDISLLGLKVKTLDGVIYSRFFMDVSFIDSVKLILIKYNIK